MKLQHTIVNEWYPEIRLHLYNLYWEEKRANYIYFPDSIERVGVCVGGVGCVGVCVCVCVCVCVGGGGGLGLMPSLLFYI